MHHGRVQQPPESTINSQSCKYEKARDELLKIMEYSAKELGHLGHLPSLTHAVEAFPPRDENRVVLQHTFEKEFTMAEIAPDEAVRFFCGQPPSDPSRTQYYGALFRFRKDGAAVLGMLRGRESGQ